MSKGSRPRPYSVSQSTFANNYDAIFGKKKDMTPRVETMKTGTCGCGRSPTGDCIGWHSLTEEIYQHKKMLWIEEQELKDNEVKDSNQGG
jgi:Na+-translocating ferredoxin:NAD+ oxidoreductase RNF subunit RnfB